MVGSSHIALLTHGTLQIVPTGDTLLLRMRVLFYVRHGSLELIAFGIQSC